MTSASRLLAVFAIALSAGCAPGEVGGGEDGAQDDALKGLVPASVRVNGHTYDVESQYLPRVVQCENGGAPTESLKAQAIAARTFLAMKTAGQAAPTIGDGQQDQVFTCSSNHNGTYVSSAVTAAVQATAGQIVMHGSVVTAGFFVAGAERNSVCAKTTDPTNTERDVTINAGKKGSAVTPSRLGSASNPANRGAMGQNLANCLAKHDGYTANQILAYFYGADITVHGSNAPSDLEVPAADDPAASTEGTSSDTSGTNTSGCFSYTTQSQLEVGACVQSSTDNLWYQCDAQGSWDPGVADMSGPVGPCTSIQS